MAEIRPATWAEVLRFNAEPSGHWIASHEGKDVAMGGFFKWGDRLWAVFDVKPDAKACGVTVVRAVLKALHDRNETVFVQCGENTFPTAKKLLHLLGFEQTDEVFNDLRVYKWQSWQL
jgi:hypothetical protein